MKHSQPSLFTPRHSGIRAALAVEPAPSSGAFGSHSTHTIRPNTRAAYHALDLTAREREVLAALESIGRAATDREVMHAMGSEDPNCCRPRLTGMVKSGVLVEVGEVKDEHSGRMVRRCWFAEAAA